MRSGRTGVPEVTQADVFDSDTATAQTISRMCELIAESCDDPLMQRVAQEAVRSFGRPDDPRAIAWGVWWAVKHMMGFVQDSPALARMFGPHDALELLISPAAMIRCRKMEGDCDDFTMMACAMLRCCGVPFEILTVAANPNTPDYSHVFPRAVMPDGTRITMDVSHGKYPGWEVPKNRQFRVQAWDESGNPMIENRARATWDGLHGYEAQGYFGLGCDCSQLDDSGNCLDPESCSTPAIPTAPPPLVTSPTTTQNDLCTINPSLCTQLQTGVAPSTASPVAQTLASLAATWSKIAGQAINPSTTICNSAGVCTTGPANAASTVAAASAIGGIPTSYLLLGGGLALGLILLMSAGKR